MWNILHLLQSNQSLPQCPVKENANKKTQHVLALSFAKGHMWEESLTGSMVRSYSYKFTLFYSQTCLSSTKVNWETQTPHFIHLSWSTATGQMTAASQLFLPRPLAAVNTTVLEAAQGVLTIGSPCRFKTSTFRDPPEEIKRNAQNSIADRVTVSLSPLFPPVPITSVSLYCRKRTACSVESANCFIDTQ